MKEKIFENCYEWVQKYNLKHVLEFVSMIYLLFCWFVSICLFYLFLCLIASFIQSVNQNTPTTKGLSESLLKYYRNTAKKLQGRNFDICRNNYLNIFFIPINIVIETFLLFLSLYCVEIIINYKLLFLINTREL